MAQTQLLDAFYFLVYVFAASQMEHAVKDEGGAVTEEASGRVTDETGGHKIGDSVCGPVRLLRAGWALTSIYNVK